MVTLHSRIRGCLLGGAVGDALGAPIEFLKAHEIPPLYGALGPSELETGRITDDTQMTLFTAEGLIRLADRGDGTDRDAARSELRLAYWRWLRTQGEQPPAGSVDGGDLTSRLTRIQPLNHRRAPGTTCLAALHDPRLGTTAHPINHSKGCGGVMRVAPVGFVPWPSPTDPFGLGCDAAALTHGHPTGWFAAGAMARIVERLAAGDDLRLAATSALVALGSDPLARETRRALTAALDLAGAGPGSAERVAMLGAGWIAEEALAIGLYGALVAPDFESAVRLAVNHGGDSDSTGSIAGQLLGALHGEAAIPSRWLARLELREVIETVADDLFRALYGPAARTGDVPVDADRDPSKRR